MKLTSEVQRALTGLCLLAFVTGCASDHFYRDGMALIEQGKPEEGVVKLAQAQESDPGNATYRKDWLLQRDRLILRRLAEAGRELAAEHWDLARERYQSVLALDAGNTRARQGVSEINIERARSERLGDAAALLAKGELEAARGLVTKVLVESPNHAGALALKRKIQEAQPPESMDAIQLNVKGRKPVTLQFRDANLRMVMEAIAHATGVNVMFDKDVKNDLKVTIFVRDAPVDEAIDLILMQTQTAKRVLSENSILIYPDTETKSKEYADLKIRRFALTNADPKQVQSMIKAMVKTKDMFIDEKANAVVIRDTPQVIRLVEKLVNSMDQPEPEVMLEVDVMEVSRDRMLALGIDLPTSFGASTSGMTLQQFRNMTADNVNVTGLNFGIKANKTNVDINDLATPRIRVRNKEKAKFLVGDRLPVVSTAAVPTANATSPIYNTNVQYVEVGIKIEVEPTIYDDGEVAIRLNLEVSSNTGQNPDAAKNGTIAYTISTRSVNTVLRLKDGQTEIIGGLIQNQDDSNGSHIPGLGDIPGFARLFGSQTDSKKKTEVILSITPHIVRNNRQADNSVLEMWSGTESNYRYNLRLSKAQVPTSAAAAQPKPATTPTPTAAAPAPAPAMAQLTVPSPVSVPAALPARVPTPIPASIPQPTPVPVPAVAAARPLARSPAAEAAARVPKPLSLNGPTNAKVGGRLELQLNQPALVNAKGLELDLNYDQSMLRLISVAEGEPRKNGVSGARFSADVDTPGSVHIELSAGHGEDLPATAGALATLQFEVLPDATNTAVSVGDVTLKMTDPERQTLPATPALAIGIQEAK